MTELASVFQLAVVERLKKECQEACLYLEPEPWAQLRPARKGTPQP